MVGIQLFRKQRLQASMTRNKRFSAFDVLMTLLFLTSALASFSAPAHALVTYTDIYISIKDVTTDKQIVYLPVEMQLTNLNTKTSINLTKFIDEEGILKHRLSVGTWKLSIKADLFSTPEVDYWGERSFVIEENVPSANEVMYLSPAGSVETFVKDDTGAIIPKAEIALKCKSFQSGGMTDLSGTVKTDAVPVCKCKGSATFNDMSGTAEVSVVQGTVVPLEIVLNKEIFTPAAALPLAISFAVLALLTLAGYLFRKKYFQRLENETKKMKHAVAKEFAQIKEQEKKDQKKREVQAAIAEKIKTQPAPEIIAAAANQDKKQELNPRARDIMATLNDKEKAIVNCLIEHEKKGSQAMLRNCTGIPKTTLVRIFKSLEDKKIINVQKIGKLNKIDLTGWFLGRE